MNRREFIGGALACVGAGCVTGNGSWRPPERWRGFNLLGMFVKRIESERPKTDPTWSRSPGFFPEEHFALMREWGFNFARVPLDYRIWIRNGDWNAIDSEALKPLDEAVRLGRQYGIHLQICLHRAPGYCVNKPAERLNLFRDTEAFEATAAHWRHLAERYRSVPTDELSFDLLNEPAAPKDEEVVSLFSRLIGVIREIDADRFIVANGCGWGNRPLPDLFGRRNVGFSMRGYAPFGLSHYHAEWVSPQQDELPVWPPKGGASGRDWLVTNNFSRWDETLRRGEFLMCNEFGCYRHTPHDVTLAWFGDMLDIFRERNIGWALWNLTGTFGVMDSQRKDVRYEKFRGHLLDREMLELLKSAS